MKKVVPTLQQEVKVDIVTSDDIKIYYTGKFQDFTARYIIKHIYVTLIEKELLHLIRISIVSASWRLREYSNVLANENLKVDTRSRESDLMVTDQRATS